MVSVQESLEQLPERFNKRVRLVEYARRLNTRFLLIAGTASFRIEITNGKVSAVQPGPFIMGEWDFLMQADEDTWQKFWRPMPPPGFHDLLALSKAKRLSIQGNIYPFMSNLLYFKELLSAARSRETH
ncbi:hypothetical protein LKR43_05765 [Pusillimonas sp. MFBS29]|uniref:hypothetical protein n=1 Tax=Pusillimonas sp. MFBS29 TaxID=2886690 RepID=UPI001D0F7B28|nr:hypothetical protein [Pusillimonas sp. MFBS29]MCC2595843.1 hypothetical protein [Pusillimonas sp. MFBS29]